MSKYLFFLTGGVALAFSQYAVEWTSPDLGNYGYGGAYGFDIDADGMVEYEVRGNSFLSFYNGNYAVAWTINFAGYPYVAAVHPRDTDGDGLTVPINTDGDAAGELVITGYYLSGSTYYGRLRIYDAASHVLEWESPLLTGFTGIASMEDLDGDGRAEIIITRYLGTESFVDVYGYTAAINEGGAGYERLRFKKSYPNPSLSPTYIPFTIEETQAGGELLVAVYDLTGRRIRLLLAAAEGAAGEYRLSWDGRNDDGQVVPPGKYFVRIGIGKETETRDITVIR